MCECVCMCVSNDVPAPIHCHDKQCLHTDTQTRLTNYLNNALSVENERDNKFGDLLLTTCTCFDFLSIVLFSFYHKSCQYVLRVVLFFSFFFLFFFFFSFFLFLFFFSFFFSFFLKLISYLPIFFPHAHRTKPP